MHVGSGGTYFDLLGQGLRTYVSCIFIKTPKPTTANKYGVWFYLEEKVFKKFWVNKYHKPTISNNSKQSEIANFIIPYSFFHEITVREGVKKIISTIRSTPRPKKNLLFSTEIFKIFYKSYFSVL